MSSLENSYQIRQYFHTVVRNAGLFTTTSFAALAYSRAYRNKNFAINISLIIASILFTIISLIMIHFLLGDIKNFTVENNGYNSISKWSVIPHILYYLDIMFIILALHILYNQFV